MSKALPKVDQKTIVKDLFRNELKSNPGKKFNYADIGRRYAVPSRTVQSWYDEVLLEQESSFLATQPTLHQRAPGTWAAAAGVPWGSAAPTQAAGAAASRAAIIPAFNPRSAAQLPAAGAAVAAFVAGAFSSQLSTARAMPVCARPTISLRQAQRAMLLGRWRDCGGRFRLRPLRNTYPRSPRFAGRPPAISSDFFSPTGTLHPCSFVLHIRR
jgi:hypothetical protein